MDASNLTRRDTLKIGAFGAAAVALPIAASASADEISTLPASKLVPYKTTFATPPLAKPIPAGQGKRPAKWENRTDVDFYRFEQVPFTAQVLAGVNTTLWGYAGCVPGPTIRATRGRKVVMRQVNRLPAQHPQLRYKPWTSTHLHGAPSKPQFDGYASDITNPGGWKDYEYDNAMNARTLWYHDHGVHHTAENAYMGLAAQYQCIDQAASTSGVRLPALYGWNDFPLVLADKAFSSSGDLLFDDEGHSSVFGDVNTVNGRAWPVMKVEPRVYRFRILNAATSRGYKLRLSDGRPMALIGTDAGLTTKVLHLTSFRIGMAERYEVLIDFSKDLPGTIVDLKNLPVKNTREYEHSGKVMRFQVVAAGQGTATAPAPASTSPQRTVKMPANGIVLSPGAPAMDLDLPLTSPIAAVRNMELGRQHGQWTIGPHTWDEVVRSGYTKVFANPMPGTVEKWIVKNDSGGWFHPLHIHLVDFRVLKRNGGAPFPYEAAGGKDVVYVGENETLELLMRFDSHTRGRYMIHCHNLTHEDHDMMTQFRVGTEVKDSVASFTDDEPFLDGNGNPVACDRDDPILARHPCDTLDI
jgi:FtsP/CotA-like multicopper oxidase with cupredoxin domain